MLDIVGKTEREVEKETTLDDRRLAAIKRGDLSWMGKGFLAVIKKDCEDQKFSEIHNKGLSD